MLHEADPRLGAPEVVGLARQPSTDPPDRRAEPKAQSSSARARLDAATRFWRTCQAMTGGVWSLARVRNTAEPGTRAILPDSSNSR